jgi:hypothetical protein
MQPYQRLLIAIALYIGAWFCLLSAAVHVPPNTEDLSDKEGLSAAIMYTVALAAIGFVAIALAIAGILILMALNRKSFTVRLTIYLASNLFLLLSSLLGMFVITAYVYDTISGIAGTILYISAISLTLSATPKRIADKKK